LFSGRVLERRGLGVGPGHEIVDLAGEMAVDDLCERVGEISVGIDVVELAALDQRGDHRPAFCAAVRPSEERILAGERERSDRPLDRIGVDLDPPIVEESSETAPMREPVADRLGELALPAQERECRTPLNRVTADRWFSIA